MHTFVKHHVRNTFSVPTITKTKITMKMHQKAKYIFFMTKIRNIFQIGKKLYTFEMKYIFSILKLPEEQQATVDQHQI